MYERNLVIWRYILRAYMGYDKSINITLDYQITFRFAIFLLLDVYEYPNLLNFERLIIKCMGRLRIYICVYYIRNAWAAGMKTVYPVFGLGLSEQM